MIGFIKDSTIDELENRIDEIEEGIASITTQLHGYQIDKDEGLVVDKEWFISANHAKRMMGVEKKQIAREITKKKQACKKADKKEKKSDHEEFLKKQAIAKKARIEELNEADRHVTRKFLEAAKKRLPRELFMSLIEEAEEEMERISIKGKL